jgi:hypothetical protein
MRTVTYSTTLRFTGAGYRRLGKGLFGKHTAACPTYFFRNRSGSFATLAAMRRASSRVISVIFESPSERAHRAPPAI